MYVIPDTVFEQNILYIREYEHTISAFQHITTRMQYCRHTCKTIIQSCYISFIQT